MTRSASRRRFLTATGGAAAALAFGTGQVGADDRRRFLIDRRSLGSERDLTVVHDLAPVDLLVARTTEERLADAGATYAPDVGYAPRLPDAARERTDEVAYPPEGEDLTDYQWDKRDQRIPEVHDVTRGEGTRVAIIDSGVAAGHPDLRGAVNADLSVNFTPDDHGAPGPYGGSHGTHVAGIVAARDTGSGVVGSAPEAELVDLRVFSETAWPGFRAWMGDVLAAIVRSAEIGADAANLSLGWTFLLRDDRWGRFWGRAMQRTTTYANRAGTVLTHACGNWGGSLQFDRDQRDSSESAGGLTVSATGPIGFRWGDPGLEEPPHAPAFYTNYGTNAVDVGAPGGNADVDAIGSGADWYRDFVVSTVAVPEFDDDGTYRGATYGYDWYAGTSMAAPQVAGAAALVRSAEPDADANQVKTAIRRTAEVPEEYDREYYGSGYLDTFAAVTE